MSSDNGVYILVTTTGAGSEYRVIHAQAIENIYWDDEIKGFGEKPNLFEVWRYFRNAEVYGEKDEALKYASDLFKQQQICEYGIEIIDVISDKYWSEIVVVAQKDPDYKRITE